MLAMLTDRHLGAISTLTVDRVYAAWIKTLDLIRKVRTLNVVVDGATDVTLGEFTRGTDINNRDSWGRHD